MVVDTNFFERNKIPGKLVAISGGFDPMHIGHVRYINAAKKLGDYLVVIVNGDSFLERKKNYKFMSLEERMEVIDSMKAVDFVVPWISEDQTVIGALEIITPDIFAKGGDRTGPENIPEWEPCIKIGCEIITGVGGDKIQSSSDLVKAFRNESN